jgi:hypothetical protein
VLTAYFFNPCSCMPHPLVPRELNVFECGLRLSVGDLLGELTESGTVVLVVG